MLNPLKDKCWFRGCHGRDCMVVRFTTTYMQSVPITSEVLRLHPARERLCNKVCQWLATGQWFSPDTPVCSTNKTDRHDIAEILLKVSLYPINLTHIKFIFMESMSKPNPELTEFQINQTMHKAQMQKILFFKFNLYKLNTCFILDKFCGIYICIWHDLTFVFT